MNRLHPQIFQQVPLLSDHRSDPTAYGSQLSRTPDDIQMWLVSYLADFLEVSVNDIDIHASFDSYGLDSVTVFGMTGDLESWLGQELEPTLPYTYPTIAALAQHCGDVEEIVL